MVGLATKQKLQTIFAPPDTRGSSQTEKSERSNAKQQSQQRLFPLLFDSPCEELEAALSSEKASGQGFGCMERL